MARYRKKGVVDAFQWFVRDRYRWMGNDVMLEDGDWIVAGQDYPIKPDEFDETYEPVEDPEHV